MNTNDFLRQFTMLNDLVIKHNYAICNIPNFDFVMIDPALWHELLTGGNSKEIINKFTQRKDNSPDIDIDIKKG